MKKIDVYEVDSAVPAPARRVDLPLERLEVGESFVFNRDEQNRVQTRCTNIKKRTGKEFTVKKQDELTARVWRIK